MSDPLRKDTDIPPSDATIVEASAGSGKTMALTYRLAQLLLTRSIPHTRLKNILAITFTNNAAREMKERVLALLKQAALGDENILGEFTAILAMDSDHIQRQAELRVDEILNNYSDFQILTIDSFLTRIFKSTAIPFGFSPDFEIVLESHALLEEGLQLFARDLTRGAATTELMNQIIILLLEGRGTSDRYLWNPFDEISVKVRDLYSRTILHSKPLIVEDFSEEIRDGGQRLIKQVLQIDALIESTPLERKSHFEKYRNAAREGDVQRLLGLKFPSPPVTKIAKPDYAQFLKRTESLCTDIAALRNRLIALHARQHFQPYAQALELFQHSIEQIKRQRGMIDIADISKQLAGYITNDTLPEIYYGLGDQIRHYLIDEFQDTSPIQWENLQPLIENALSQGGTLFLVGDMKQSIYGFRGADWRIMQKLMQTSVFPSARPTHSQLTENRRSYERVLNFSDTVFKTVVPTVADSEAAGASGLNRYVQTPAEHHRGKGYVELKFFESAPQQPAPPEKEYLLNCIDSCLRRGYHYRDIAILTPKNQTVIRVSEWLNEQNIAFISHSSLDVRNRKCIGELLSLLQFLDSPIDDLAFSSFLLGDLFGALLRADGLSLTGAAFHEMLVNLRTTSQSYSPLYTSFRSRYPDLWARYFDRLFSLTGYMPLYDLVSEMIKHFRVFDILPDEEASVAKLLAVIKSFEETGGNNLKAFLHFAGGTADQSDWNIAVTPDAHAVSVMTLHKAKGLGFRVVIVLLYDTKPHPDGLSIIEDDDGLRLLHLTKKIAEEVPEFQPLLHEKEINATVDDLNKLYVVLTRAREELYVLSVVQEKSPYPSSYLPAAGFEPATPPPVSIADELPKTAVPLFHHHQSVLTHTVEPQKINLQETERGELIHRILSRITILEDNPQHQLQRLIEECSHESRSRFNQAQLLDILMRFVTQPETLLLFSTRPGRTVQNEQEYVTREGRLQRMDRVILDAGQVMVIDYKTGDEREEYADQVRGYMSILKEVYPERTVTGILAYVDRHLLRIVA